MFPIEKPYSFLYSVNALSACLREEVLEVGFYPTKHDEIAHCLCRSLQINHSYLTVFLCWWPP